MFSKHFHLCFCKLKCPTATATPPHLKQPSSSSPSPSSTSTFLFSDDFSSSSDSDSSDPPPPPDFSSLFASHRFFFSSPGLSNSIIESPDTRPTSTTTTPNSHSDTTPSTLLPRGVGVPQYSADPYVDFRSSMQEMIESRGLVVNVTRDWDYLHDLLLCYLALNHPQNHRHIVRAFTDLVVHLLSSLPPPSETNTQEPAPL